MQVFGVKCGDDEGNAPYVSYTTLASDVCTCVCMYSAFVCVCVLCVEVQKVSSGRHQGLYADILSAFEAVILLVMRHECVHV